MLKTGILNPQLLSLLARVRHTNTLVIADRGFPSWPQIETVDLSRKLSQDEYKAVFPDLAEAEAVRELWEAIFATSRVDGVEYAGLPTELAPVPDRPIIVTSGAARVDRYAGTFAATVAAQGTMPGETPKDKAKQSTVQSVTQGATDSGERKAQEAALASSRLLQRLLELSTSGGM